MRHPNVTPGRLPAPINPRPPSLPPAGMLASWFRIKYPASTVGAIAASAPILQFTGITPPQAYNQVVTRTWAAANPNAPVAIFQLWQQLATLAQQQPGRDAIRTTLGICDALTSPSDVTNGVYNFISNAIGYMT
jgi:lysosomal Pro-X carboxypeptidase